MLDDALKQQRLDQAEEAIAPLDARLSAVIDGLAGLLDAAASTVEPAPRVATGELSDELPRLQRLLDAGDASAADAFRNIETALREHYPAHQIDRLGTEITAFEFDAAAATCNRLRERR